MGNPFSDTLPNVMEKRDYLTYMEDKKADPFLVNRMLAMNPEYIASCNKINIWLPKDIWKKVIWFYTPKRQFRYAHWLKTKKDENDWFYQRVAKFYNCSLRSLAGSKEIIMENKELYATRVGLDDTERKKLGLEVVKVKVEKMKPEPEVKLARWFK